jgi:alpha-L-fucosidase
VLYATSLGWPADGTFRIHSLRRGNLYESRAIVSVDFISGAGKLEWTQTDEALVIQAGSDKPCEAAYVFRIKFRPNK